MHRCNIVKQNNSNHLPMSLSLSKGQFQIAFLKAIFVYHSQTEPIHSQYVTVNKKT